MTEDKDNWIGIIMPTKDGKYKIARATIDNRDADKLSDCIISVSDVEGKLEDLKYPFVLVKDIDILKEKLIEDFKEGDRRGTLVDMNEDIIIEEVERIISKRFGKSD